MKARIAAAAFGVLLTSGCADTFGPDRTMQQERLAPPWSGSHLAQQFLITPVSLDFGQVPVGTTAPEQHVIITNIGHGAVEMSGAGGAAGVFGGAQDCQGTTLAEGASCRMTYAFTPVSAGPVEVTTSGTWNGQAFTITLRGEGVAQERFTISGTSLDFGQVDVGSTSAPQTVVVTNRGPGAAVMDGAGGAAGVFGGSQNCQGRTLAEGESCEMVYQFTPVEGGVVTQSTSGTWNGQPFTLSFRGEGMQSPRFEITPTAFDFGEVNVGGFSTVEVVNVTNTGADAVLMTGIGGAAAGFETFQTCEGMVLGAGASCQMFYVFMPQAEGEVASTAAGSWNGQAYSIALRGVGIAPDATPSGSILITTRGLDFGHVEVGGMSAPQHVMVTNIGASPVVMNGAGGAAGVFGGSQNCQGTTLNPGESCQMTYRFAPTTGGEAVYTTSGTWNGESYSISFRGYGIQRNRFLITPVAHDFGSVDVGTSSNAHIIRVTNVGPGMVVMDGAGGAAGEFGGSQNCQGVALVEGASCEMFYQFTPVTAGEVVRTTSGSWNGQPFSFSFRGVGVQRDRFLISPTGFDFGVVMLGTTSPAQHVTVTNIGPGPVTMDGAGGAAGEFGGVQNCQGVTLAEGGSCTMSYSFTPTTEGLAEETTSGSWNGQPFSLTFRGTGANPAVAAIRVGEFLPPMSQRTTVQAGSTLPVKARLYNADDTVLSDAQAMELANACSVVMTATTDPSKTYCARYIPGDRHFQVQFQVPRLVRTGTHQIILEVRLNGAVVSRATADFNVRGR